VGFPPGGMSYRYADPISGAFVGIYTSRNEGLSRPGGSQSKKISGPERDRNFFCAIDHSQLAERDIRHATMASPPFL
jgi:hypothetical protein